MWLIKLEKDTHGNKLLPQGYGEAFDRLMIKKKKKNHFRVGCVKTWGTSRTATKFNEIIYVLF